MNTVLNPRLALATSGMLPAVLAAFVALAAFGTLSADQAVTLLGGWTRRDELTEADVAAIAVAYGRPTLPPLEVLLGGLLNERLAAGAALADLKDIAAQLGVTSDRLADAYVTWAAWHVTTGRTGGVGAAR